MISTVLPDLPASTPVASAWDSRAESYLARWPEMNRALERRAFELLPDMPEEALIHLAGVGGGKEIQPLVRLYPANTILATDISSEMVNATDRALKSNTREFPVHLARADLHAPPVTGIDASISFFTLHLVRDPARAVRAQWESLASGGLFASVYFPPLPLGEYGPLVSLYQAMRKLVDKPPSPWEENALEYLEQVGARKLERRDIYAKWRFDSLYELRPTFEALPHIAGIRNRLGEERYAEFWRHFHGNPGVERVGDSLVGPVGAVLLTARKP